MTVHFIKNFRKLTAGVYAEAFRKFVNHHPQGNYFQSIDFLELCDGLPNFEACLILVLDNNDNIAGSLLGVFQTNGTGLKSWFSRRLLVWGGPLVQKEKEHQTNKTLLKALKNHAAGRAIFIEFRNLFSRDNLHEDFQHEGFQFQPYLNFLIRTDNETMVQKRLHGNRRREINKSLKSGAIFREAASRAEVQTFYTILADLYRERVKKPLPGMELFIKLWQSDAAKLFVVLYKNKIIGGAACPTFNHKVIYDWFHCGQTNIARGVFAGVLAAWAPIQYALANGYEYMDFMGAGRPDQPYGVRDFKSRYGGELVAFGRYVTILNRPLFEIGKFGLKAYQKLKLVP